LSPSPFNSGPRNGSPFIKAGRHYELQGAPFFTPLSIVPSLIFSFEPQLHSQVSSYRTSPTLFLWLFPPRHPFSFGQGFIVPFTRPPLAPPPFPSYLTLLYRRAFKLSSPRYIAQFLVPSFFFSKRHGSPLKLPPLFPFLPFSPKVLHPLPFQVHISVLTLVFFPPSSTSL